VNSQKTPAISAVDAVALGLKQTARRPWLVLVPLALDLLLWMAPPLSVSGLMRRFLAVWEALLRATYPPDQSASMNELITAVRETMTKAGTQFNLLHVITGSWLSAPSAIVSVQNARQTLVSDMILAPVGLALNLPVIMPAPWQPAPVEINGFWAAVLIALGLWLVGQVIVALYVRGAAPGRQTPATTTAPGPDPWSGLRGFLGLVARLTLLSLVLGVSVFVLRMPLAVAMSLLVLSGSGATALLFAIIGGVTLWMLLWFLTSLFFVSESVLIDHQPLLRSIVRSVTLVRLQSLSTIGLVLMINLVMLGFRAVWGVVGQSVPGAVLAIAANAYLATSMMLAIFAYYEDRRRRLEAQLAQARQNAAMRNQMKD
jgi:hypothetical protein